MEPVGPCVVSRVSFRLTTSVRKRDQPFEMTVEITCVVAGAHWVACVNTTSGLQVHSRNSYSHPCGYQSLKLPKQPALLRSSCTHNTGWHTKASCRAIKLRVHGSSNQTNIPCFSLTHSSQSTHRNATLSCDDHVFVVVDIHYHRSRCRLKPLAYHVTTQQHDDQITPMFLAGHECLGLAAT
jgi:hypothetical protein